MEDRERFLSVYREHIHREGSERLLDYLLSEYSDFFHASANTRFHDTHTQEPLEHSPNVYDCLKDCLSCPRVKECYHIDCNEETIAIVALLHGICKINCYKESTRNQKVNGQWAQAPFYECEDRLPYGHDKKSVYIITGFVRLSRKEAFAIRYHMGFNGNEEVRNADVAFEMYPFAFTLSTAGMEVTYYLEGKQQAVMEEGRKQTK